MSADRQRFLSDCAFRFIARLQVEPVARDYYYYGHNGNFVALTAFGTRAAKVSGSFLVTECWHQCYRVCGSSSRPLTTVRVVFIVYYIVNYSIETNRTQTRRREVTRTDGTDSRHGRFDNIN